MQKLFALVLILCAALPWTAQAQSEQPAPITLTDATGTEVTIQSLERIVSGTGDVTEIIDALGFYHNLVGVDSTSTFPAAALETLPSIGFKQRLTVEPILALDPTVFFCSQTCGTPETLQQLRDLGVPVVIVPDSEDGGLALPFQKVEMVAAALGVPAAGERLQARIEQELDWVTTALSTVITEIPPAVLHLYVRNQGLQLAGGSGTPAQYMIEAAGGRDAGAEAGVTYYQPLTPEVLFSAYPDYLLFTAGSVEAAGGLENVLEIQGIGDSPAAEAGNLIILDTGFLLNMSTRTGQAVLALAAAIHPQMLWELSPSYPYSYRDHSDHSQEIEGPRPLVLMDESLRESVSGLGFHPEQRNEARDSDLILALASQDWQPLREQGLLVLVLPDDFTVEDVAVALNVPGRGESLLARQAGGF